MLKLMKLELQQNRLRLYLLSSLGITVALLGFVYLFAAIPHLKAGGELEEMVMGLVNSLFGNYENIIALTSILSMFCFGVLSATMLSRFVVSDYSGKRANLLFAYPVNRGKLFCAKVVLVFLFTVLAMIVSNTLLFGAFFLAESISPLVTAGILSADLIGSTIKITIVFSLLSGAIGLISLWFGFGRKSIPATLIPSYILASIFSNILGSTMLLGGRLDNTVLQFSVTGVALLTGILLVCSLMEKVKTMEAI